MIRKTLDAEGALSGVNLKKNHFDMNRFYIDSNPYAYIKQMLKNGCGQKSKQTHKCTMCSNWHAMNYVPPSRKMRDTCIMYLCTEQLYLSRENGSNLRTEYNVSCLFSMGNASKTDTIDSSN